MTIAIAQSNSNLSIDLEVEIDFEWHTETCVSESFGISFVETSDIRIGCDDSTNTFQGIINSFDVFLNDATIDQEYYTLQYSIKFNTG
jgi:hypothetical protein